MILEIDLQLCYASDKARPIDSSAVKALAHSIAEFGLLNPIVVRRVQKSRAGQTPDSYEVIAGLHRLKAFRYLQRTTIPATVLDVDDLHAELMLIDENLCRNDLSPAERAVAQARRKAIYQQIHPETKAGASGKYRPKSQFGQVGQAENHPAPRYDEAAAEATGQSERAVRRDVTRGEALGEDVLAKVARTSLDKGEELDALAKLSPDHRNVLIARAASGEKVSAKVEVKKEHRAARERELGARQIAAPDGKFGVIVEDYEWDHVTWSEQGRDRAAENHYPVSRDAHTAQEIVRRTKDRFACAADDCVCFQWTTLQHLAIAIDVLRLRGFEYKSSYAWGKDKIGLGYWSREKHEILLIGVKGNIACPALGTQWEIAGYGAARRALGQARVLPRNDRAIFSNAPQDRTQSPRSSTRRMEGMGQRGIANTGCYGNSGTLRRKRY